MTNNTIVEQVYELVKLQQMGFLIWVTRVEELVETHSINIDDAPAKFKSKCKWYVFHEKVHINGFEMFKTFKEILSWEYIVKPNNNLAWKHIQN